MAIQKLNNQTTQESGVVTPKPNLLEVVTDGYLTIYPRNENITLTTTNIGYRFDVYIDTPVTISANAFINTPPIVDVYAIERLGDVLYNSYRIDGASGLWLSDGTNSIWYDYNASVEPFVETPDPFMRIKISFNLRLISGTYTLNPYQFFTGEIYYRVVNSSLNIGEVIPSGGGDITGDSKYIFEDRLWCNVSTGAKDLESETAETYNGSYKYHPRRYTVTNNVPGFSVPFF